MSAPNVLALRDEDVKLMLTAKVHLGTKNCDSSMEDYVWRRRQDGQHKRTHTHRYSSTLPSHSTVAATRPTSSSLRSPNCAATPPSLHLLAFRIVVTPLCELLTALLCSTVHCAAASSLPPVLLSV